MGDHAEGFTEGENGAADRQTWVLGLGDTIGRLPKKHRRSIFVKKKQTDGSHAVGIGAREHGFQPKNSQGEASQPP